MAQAHLQGRRRHIQRQYRGLLPPFHQLHQKNHPGAQRRSQTAKQAEVSSGCEVDQAAVEAIEVIVIIVLLGSSYITILPGDYMLMALGAIFWYSLAAKAT